jgi:hypothetical protein
MSFMVISRRKPVRSKRDPRPDTVSDTSATEPSYTWRALVDQLVTQHGTLTRVAELLAESRGFRDDVASIERALRRLRARHAEPGGVWGARLLARFGLPDEPARRARWMGTYHSRFTDLPVDVCESLLRLWDAGPVRESRARVWIELGYCAAWLRRSELDRAERALLSAHALLVNAHPAAEVEWALGEAFVASLREDPARSQRALTRAKSALDANKAAIEPDEHACLLARWTDQRAFALNQSRAPEREREAEALYAALSERDAPAFARCRRENGLAYARMRAGDRDAAVAHAERAARAAGDAGALRLRAMALLMLVKIKGPRDGAEELARAETIARELGDAQLAARVERQRR